MVAEAQNGWDRASSFEARLGKLSRLSNRDSGSVRRRHTAIAPPPPYEILQNEAERSRNVL